MADEIIEIDEEGKIVKGKYLADLIPKKPTQSQKEWVEKLKSIRCTLESCDINCLGVGENGVDGMTWPIRDEVIDSINKLLSSLPAPTEAPELPEDMNVLVRELSERGSQLFGFEQSSDQYWMSKAADTLTAYATENAELKKRVEELEIK